MAFCKGLKIDNGAQVTLLPGIYYIKGELWDQQGIGTRITGTDVMIYLTDHPGLGYVGKGLKVGSASIFDLTGRTGADDPYRGIAIFVDRSLDFHTADVTFESGSELYLGGVIYAPNQITRIHSGATGYATSGAAGIAIVSDFFEATSSLSELAFSNDFSYFGDEALFKEAILLE